MRALVFGHYGGRNFGDELMLAGLLHLLAKRGAERVEITTADGEVGENLKGKVDGAVRARSPLGLLRAILRSDTVILGGGTIFHDAYPDIRHRSYLKNLVLITAIFTLARLLGRKIYLIGVGIGPLSRKSTRFLTRILRSVSHGISVRDEQSFRDLDSLGGAHGSTIIASDLSFFAPYAEQTQASTARTGPFHIGFSLVPAEVVTGAEASAVEAIYDAMIDNVGRIPAEQIAVSFFCANVGADSDVGVAQNLAEKLRQRGVAAQVVPFTGDPFTFVAPIAGLDALVAARYHVAIAATMVGLEPVWLAYQRKVLDAAADLDVPKDRVFSLKAVAESSVERQRLLDLLDVMLTRTNPSSEPAPAAALRDPLGIMTPN